VVVAVVVVSLVYSGTAMPVATPTATAGGTSAIVGDAPAAPKFLSASASADGTAVTFQFAAVKNAAGYRWAPSEQPDSSTGIPTPTVVRHGVVPGQRVCVQIETVAASGRVSDPTERCFG
jgi:hypothetical protein